MEYFEINLKEHYPFLGEDGKNPLLQCYLPAQFINYNYPNDYRKTVVICPGGAYRFTSDREAEPVALFFLKKRYNVFVLRYSVKPHRFPSQILECAATFDLLYKNKEKWHINTEHIAIMGFSAGGHLAAHYANKYDCEEIKQYFDKPHAPTAQILCYPVISADPTIYHAESFYNLTGVNPDGFSHKDYSCEYMVTNKTPRAFIMHTDRDTVVPVENSYVYAMALKKHNVLCEMHIYPCCDHGISLSNNVSYNDYDYNRFKSDFDYAANWASELDRWLEKFF